MPHGSATPLDLTLVVGTGPVGRTLALAQARYGDRVLLLGRSRGPWIRWARAQGIAPLLGLGPEPLRPRRVLIAVPDRELAAAARAVAGWLVPDRRRFAAHVSGFHDLRVLAPFARRGARVAALHPVLPFGDPHDTLVRLQGALVTVLAGPGARRPAGRLVARWGARPLFLSRGLDRRRYHLGHVLAANHVTALLAWAEELLRPALGRRARGAVCDLAAQALDRVRTVGPDLALTGPVVRGDAEVVAGHVRALRSRERERYRSLLDLVLALAERSGRLDRAGARAIRALVRRGAAPRRRL